jgi:hypothetical protein
MVSKSPIVTWQGTHCEFIKLIKRANVSCPHLDIHKSKDVVVVIEDSRARITYSSMVLEIGAWMVD